MKIGIILTGYAMQEYVNSCLEAWIIAREQQLNGNEFVICAVSVPFAGFPNREDDGTVRLLDKILHRYEIDHLIVEPKEMQETEARGSALKWLKEKNVDIVWQVDLDEFYTIEQIRRILMFIESNQFIAWFRLSLKNYIFNDKTYLIEPFTPPRIHRIKYQNQIAYGFSADNDIYYEGTRQSRGVPFINQDQLSNMTIPQSVAWIKHLTWQNNDRSRCKIQYQLKGRGWPQCSFSWNEERGLIFNPALPTPKIAHDS